MTWFLRAAAAVAGGLLPLSLSPFGYEWLALLTVAALFALIERFPNQVLSLGVAFGLGKYAVGVSWVYVSIHQFGNASVPLALALVGLFVVGLTVLFTVPQFLLLKGLLALRPRPLERVLLFVTLWVLSEWLQTWLLTGFPWLFAGSGQLTSAYLGYAPVFGVLGVSAVVVGSATALVYAVQQLLGRRIRTGFLSFSVVAALYGAGLGFDRISWVELGLPRSVALVQGNVDQATKWRPENREPIIGRYLELSAPHWGRDLIVWPEASITLLEHQAAPRLQRWSRQGEARGTTLVLGIPSVQPDPRSETGYRFNNMAVALGAGEGRYAKRRLVPFGEYVPLESVLRGLIDFFDLPMSRARPGDRRQRLLDLDGVPASMAICYEIAYPDLIAADVPEAQVLLTISNDAWFGASIGPHQHLQLAQMRAREAGRYVLRSTNSGVTAIIDERGRIVDRLAQFQPGVLTGEFRPATGATPYARYGDLPLLVLVVLAALAVVSLRAFAPGQSR
ncbi:MAG: apolipoprotein N-acyltransferase [Pseudomonadota bacterium]